MKFVVENVIDFAATNISIFRIKLIIKYNIKYKILLQLH